MVVWEMTMGDHKILDFDLAQDNSTKILVTVKDPTGVLVPQIDSAVGRFGISASPTSARLFERDTVNDPTSVWFIWQAPIWQLAARIFVTDLSALTPGTYFYEMRIDAPPDQQNTVRSGWFRLLPAIL